MEDFRYRIRIKTGIIIFALLLLSVPAGYTYAAYRREVSCTYTIVPDKASLKAALAQEQNGSASPETPANIPETVTESRN